MSTIRKEETSMNSISNIISKVESELSYTVYDCSIDFFNNMFIMRTRFIPYHWNMNLFGQLTKSFNEVTDTNLIVTSSPWITDGRYVNMLGNTLFIKHMGYCGTYN